VYDLVISGAKVLDGSGEPAQAADVGVSDGRIAVVTSRPGLLSKDGAAEWVAAAGLTLAPGFIDVHSHADVALLADSAGGHKLRQGVTTEVFSNCGLGFAPVTDAGMAAMRAAFGGLFSQDDGVTWKWRTVAQYLHALEEHGIGTNVAYLAPHGAIRASAMGMSARPASRRELAKMQGMLESALTEGAIGLSTGPGYAPMSHAEPAELIALARQAGFVAIHQRNYREDLLACTAQTAELAAISGARLQLSHLQTSGEAARGLGPDAIRVLDDARRRGVDIACDMYPYTAGSTVLQAILPDWVTDGGAETTLRRLSDPACVPRIVAALTALDRHWPSMVLISAENPRNRRYVGCTFPEIAEARGRSVAETVCSILLEEELRACYVVHHMEEQDLDAILSWPDTMIGSDGLHLRGAAHPRVAGTFARWIGPFVRDRRLVSLPEAVRRVTALPAARLGLDGRGRIAPGYWADLVLFDARSVSDRATFDDPLRSPEGIPFVWVNGSAAARPGGAACPRNGKVLRSGAPKSAP